MTINPSLEKTIARIKEGVYSRADLTKIYRNASTKLKDGHTDAQRILDAINQAKPVDDFIVFMGFCLGGSLENRLDQEWKEEGICTFHFFDSPHQMDDFNSILVGDLIILKKRHQFGKTMQLFGHGRVTGVQYDKEDHRFLTMNWSSQDQIIEVPLMGCNATVDIRTVDRVEDEMPPEFYAWLEQT